MSFSRAATTDPSRHRLPCCVFVRIGRSKARVPPLLRMLPHQYQEFVQGIELMRQGYGSGELSYSLMVAEKP